MIEFANSVGPDETANDDRPQLNQIVTTFSRWEVRTSMTVCDEILSIELIRSGLHA